MRAQPESPLGAARAAPAPPRAEPASILRFGDCELDFARHELRRGGELVALQPPAPR